MRPAPSAPPRVILRDAASGRWLEFTQPRQLVQASTLSQVAPSLDCIQQAVIQRNLYAAGFVSYEAAPAFDNTLAVNPDAAFPLLWFGLYESAEPVELPAPPPLAELDPMDWQPSVAQPQFEQAVAQIKALIQSGDTYQVNYTYRLNAPLVGDPWSLFLQLVAAQDPPYGAFVDTGDWAICSASPELFFRLDGHRIQCRPMKGTAARGRTQAEDLAQARALQASDKERAENVMIVDMVRHDLGRIAQTGSVKVARLFQAERYPTIWQMTSTIEASTDAGLADIFRALFPPASITGAPKVRTMQIIAELESLPRRLYTGTIGFFAPGRRAQFNVAIRTLLAHRQTARAEYGVGSGITWDSDPAAEWRECVAKTAILSAPLPAFSLLETMRWTPAEGFFLLERHLQRLQDSADYFAFPLDLPALRRELDHLASTFAQSPQRIRLLVSRQGQFTLETEPLPAPAASPPRVALARAPVESSDPLLYHKTTHRAVYETARAARPGFDDVLLFNERGEITESTIANVAVDIAGQLCTPPVSSGLLPGTLRGHLLQHGQLTERRIVPEELLQSPHVLLFNSVRGLYPVIVV